MIGDSMERTLKVFATGSDQRKVADTVTKVVESYDAFVVAEATTPQTKELQKQFLVEDITDQYTIPVGGAMSGPIDTEIPRLTEKGRTASHPSYKGAKQLTPGPHHYLVQFRGPVKEAWLADVRKAGGDVVDSHAGFAVVVRANEKQIASIVALPSVRWTGHLPPQARIEVSDPDAPTLPRTRLLPSTLVVEFFSPAQARAAKAELRKIGLRVIPAESSGTIFVVEQPESTAAAERRQLDRVADIHGVRVVRRKAINRISNNVAVKIMSGGPNAVPVAGLDGEGEIIGICDTGLDTGSVQTAHPDFAGRVRFLTSYAVTSDYSSYIRNPGADDGAADLDSGHGTHVAGSAVGDGSASASIAGQAPIRSLAYKAQLVFQAVEQALDWRNPGDLERNGRYALAGIPADVSRIFDEAYRHGARIHSNSWGGGDPGAYDAQSRQLDQFVWDHPTMCILVAVGNDGTDNDRDGRINLGSVTSPATAKNCIAVGASENLRRQFDSDTYGSFWPLDYPVAPYKNAPMADDPGQVVAFSSRGPTADGRMKPDVVAPGTWILSTKSTMLSPTANGWKPFSASPRYFYMGGTSMATPLTAGAVAALRQHVRRDHGIAQPTAALLKAVLIASAERLANTAPAGTVVDPHQGYGRVNVAAIATPAAGVAVVLQQNRKVATGAVRRTTVIVTGSNKPLKVVLAYSDFPGTQLVNNVNLVVHSPNGDVFVGNQVDGAPPNFDSTNNVEVVSIPSAASGQWTIEVIGSNIPRGPQPFALVILGRIA